MESIFGSKILDLRTFGRWDWKLRNEFNECYSNIETVILPLELESVRNCFNDLPNLKKIILCGGEFGITQSFNGSPKLESIVYQSTDSNHSKLGLTNEDEVCCGFEYSFIKSCPNLLDFRGCYVEIASDCFYNMRDSRLEYYSSSGVLRLSCTRDILEIASFFLTYGKMTILNFEKETKEVDYYTIEGYPCTDDLGINFFGCFYDSIRYLVLDCSESNPKTISIRGITAFCNLKYIYCPSNKVLDISNMLGIGINYGKVTILCDNTVKVLGKRGTYTVRHCTSISKAIDIMKADAYEEKHIMEQGIAKANILNIEKEYIHPASIQNIGRFATISHKEERTGDLEGFIWRERLLKTFGIELTDDFGAFNSPGDKFEYSCERDGIVHRINSIIPYRHNTMISRLSCNRVSKSALYGLPAYIFLQEEIHYPEIDFQPGDRLFMYHYKCFYSAIIEGKCVPKNYVHNISKIYSSLLRLGVYENKSFFRLDALHGKVLQIEADYYYKYPEELYAITEKMQQIENRRLLSGVDIDYGNELLTEEMMLTVIQVYTLEDWIETYREFFDGVIYKLRQALY